MARWEKRVRHLKLDGRRCLIAGLLGMVTALMFGATASATVTGQTYTATVSPKKQDRNAFGGAVSVRNVIDTQYQDLSGANPDQITLRFSRDIRFTPAHAPPCDLAEIQGRFTAAARFACQDSVIGEGSAQIVIDYTPPPIFCCSSEPATVRFANLVTGDAVVTLFNGPRSSSQTVYLLIDLFTDIPFTTLDLVGSLDTQANTLTLGRLPTGGFEFPHLDLTIHRSWVAVPSGRKFYYVRARCKKGKWTNSATTNLSDGSTMTASSTQKCRRKKS